MASFIVERSFATALTGEDLQSLGTRMEPCLSNYRVEWVRSYLSADRKRSICHYEAADAGSVRSVQREADAQFDRIWLAESIGPTEDGAALRLANARETERLLREVERLRPAISEDAKAAEADRQLPFGSGCHHAKWLAMPAAEFDGESPRTDPETGQPAVLGTFFPRPEARILDTWHTLGMRGTGSTDYAVEDLFIPDHMVAPVCPLRGPAPEFSDRCLAWPWPSMRHRKRHLSTR